MMAAAGFSQAAGFADITCRLRHMAGHDRVVLGQKK